MKLPKIHQKTLFKISLIVSLFGILLLLFLANSLEPKLIDISSINDEMLNQQIKISGEIFKIQDKETFKILSISDSTGKIDVLCECREELIENNQIKNNQEIIVIGRVTEYREYLQISADKIIKPEN